MKTKSMLIILSFCFSFSSLASNGNTWSLNTGKKHPLYSNGETIQSLEAKVFSKETSFEKRWRFVFQVANLKGKSASMRFLKKCLASKEWFLQSAALKALQRKHPEVAVKLAEKTLLNSKALVVRSEAVNVINALGGPNDTEKLWLALKQRNNFKGRASLWIRPQIVKSIFKLERSKHSERWVDLISDSDAEIRDIAKKVVEKN